MTDSVNASGSSRRDVLRYALAAAGAATLPAASAPGAAGAALPLVRPRLARLGDSITQFADYAQPDRPVRISRRARGAMTWVKTLFPAFDDDTWHYPPDARQRRYMRGSNNGLAGDHLAYLSPANPGTLRRWTDEVAPMRPDLVVLSVGTNDVNSYAPAGLLEDELSAHIDAITGGGRTLLLTTIRPRAGAGGFGWGVPDPLTDRRYAVREAVNGWIRSRTGAGLAVADVNEHLEDPASRAGAGGDWLPALTPPDGIHPGPRAAWAEAQTLLPILRWLIAANNVYGTDPLARGNLLPNGAFAGHSGRLGQGVTGRCATGWAIGRVAGDARLTAYRTAENGIDKQVLEIRPGARDSTFILRTDPARISLADLDDVAWLRFHLHQEVSPYAGWKAYSPRLLLSGGGPAWAAQASALETDPGELLPDVAWAGWPATHPVHRPPGDLTASCSVLITVAGGVPGIPVLTFSRAQLRHVPDPRIAWQATSTLRA